MPSRQSRRMPFDWSISKTLADGVLGAIDTMTSSPG